MKVTLPKDFIYQILLFVSVFVPYLNNYELTFCVWSLATLITFQNKLSLEILKHLACYISIFLIAVFSSFWYDHEAYFIIRDITYISKPIIGLLLGYQLAKKLNAKTLKVVVIIGLLIACYHIYIILYSVLFYSVSNINELRYFAGFFSDFEVYTLILLVFHDKFELHYPRKKLILYIILIGFSTFMYLARTNFIQFLILLIAMKGFLKINVKSITVLASIVLLSIIGYATILYINPKRNGEGLEAFLYKIKVAPIEPFKTKIKRDDWKDFNDNYRSYENIMTVRQMTNDGYKSLIFGQGLGSQIDLKQKLMLGDMELRFISILHNGFMTVLLKSGLIGVILLIISIYLIFIKKKSQIPLVNNLNLLMIGSGVYMIVSYWVFMGYYFAADTKSIFFGLIICYRELVLKESKVKNEYD
ncbi:hypothetical protein [Flavobacterium sp.]|jgi:hypothetical protein|uniref:hypothetical protein n=1 Tax=Flavobacterium sp. TaxID=239 RepID=UPI0037BE2424